MYLLAFTASQILFLALGTAAGFILAWLISSLRLKHLDAVWRERFGTEVDREIRGRERAIRRDAAARSGKVLSGKVLERFSPLTDQFPFDPHDAVWIGSPIDFLVFDGLSEDRSGDDSLRRVVFVEVKSGGGSLSSRQRRIRDIISEGKVEWKEVRLS